MDYVGFGPLHRCSQIRKRDKKRGSYTAVVPYDYGGGQQWDIRIGEIYKVVEIKFCPWCGRKLLKSKED